MKLNTLSILAAGMLLVGAGCSSTASVDTQAPTIEVETDGGGQIEVTQEPTPAPTPKPEPTPTPEEPSGAKAYTMAEVAVHKDSTSCWSAVNGSVYDLTTWINRHPGGSDFIKGICGKDGSGAFNGQHMGDQKPEKMLASFKIGIVK